LNGFLNKYKWPFIIGACAFLVRLVYLFEISNSPDFISPMIDEKWHWEWAHRIFQDSFWGEGAYFRAPLYPYFLALLAFITKSSVFWAKLLQSLICFGTTFFIYRLTEHLFNRNSAITAGFIYAFYGTLIFYETMFLIPILFVFFSVWGMYRYIYFFESKSFKTWGLTGLIFGLAAISRPNILLVIPFLMLWHFLRNKISSSFLKKIALPLIMALGVLVAIIPVTIRNQIVTGEFILISSQGGINLYLGNNPDADGLTMLMPEIELDESVSWRQFGTVTKIAAEKINGHEMSDAEISSFWTDQAIDFIVNNPGDFLNLVWEKTVYLVNGFENSDNIDIYHQRSKSILYSLLLWSKLFFFPFGLLLPLFVAGVYINRKETIKLAPLYIYLIAYIPSIVLFLVTARHRLSLIPFLIIIAAAGLVKLPKLFKPFKAKPLVTSLLLFIISFVLINRTYYDLGKISSDFQIYFNNGIAYERLGDYKNAEKEYLKADEAYAFSPPLINNLAHVQFLLGQNDNAELNYQRAIKLDSNYALAYNNYGLVMQKRGKLDSALTLYKSALTKLDPVMTEPDTYARTYTNIASVYESLQINDSALSYYEKAMTNSVDNGTAYFKASSFFARLEEYEKADSLFETGLKISEPSAGNCFNQGLSLLKRKDLVTAVKYLKKAINSDSSLYQASYCLAAAYYNNLDAPIDSVAKYLDLCFRFNPAYEPALKLKEELN